MNHSPLPPEVVERIESTLKIVDREVWAITASDGASRGALTATWVSQASINRNFPTLLIGLAPNHATAKLVLKSRRFLAHLLRSDQASVAYKLAAVSGVSGTDKLAEFTLIGDRPEDAPPMLASCLAWLECQVFHYYDCGDRWFFWADIIDAGTPFDEPVGEVQPLREQSFFKSLKPEQRAQLLAARDAELPLHQSWADMWRTMGEEVEEIDLSELDDEEDT